jgi:hypothetical protein
MRWCEFELNGEPMSLFKMGPLQYAAHDISSIRLFGMTAMNLATTVLLFSCFATDQPERDANTQAGAPPGLSSDAEFLLSLFAGIVLSTWTVLAVRTAYRIAKEPRKR